MLTTTEDIRACFRLLLGREPNPEEWPGHSSRVGEPLAAVVRSFLASKECQARGLLSKEGLDDIQIANVNGKAVAARANDRDIGRHVLSGDYEPHITALFHRVIKPGMRVFDVGANCGYFTSLALSLVGALGHVWAIEPNPDNVRLLEIARRRNNARNLTIVPAAAGEYFGAASFYGARSTGMVGPLADNAGIDNVAALVTLDGLAHDFPADLIKIDVEGYEGHVFRGAQMLLSDRRPALVFGFSPNGLDGMTGPELMDMLRDFGYRIAVVRADGEIRYLDNASIMESHQATGTDHIDLYATPG